MGNRSFKTMYKLMSVTVSRKCALILMRQLTGCRKNWPNCGTELIVIACMGYKISVRRTQMVIFYYVPHLWLVPFQQKPGGDFSKIFIYSGITSLDEVKLIYLRHLDCELS